MTVSTHGRQHAALIHIAKRDSIHPLKAALIRVAAIILALLVCAVVINSVTGLNPLKVYMGVIDGAMGTPRRTWVTIRDALVLLCVAIGLTPAFKMHFWNIGAEGQILVGAIASAALMINASTLPGWLLLPLSGRQSTVLFPDGKEGALERQLRTNAWLRAAGLERGMVYIVCDGLSSQARQEAELFARDRDYLCVLTRAQLCAILKMEREHDEAGRTDDSRHGAERAVSESGKRL